MNKKEVILNVKFFTILGFFLLSGLSFVMDTRIALASKDWELERDKEGIQVYLKEVKNGIDEFKVVTQFNTSLDTLIAILTDIPSYPEWFYKCKEAMVVEEVTFSERYIYQVNDFPWPVQDRDMVSHFLLSYDQQNKEFTVTMDGRAKHIPEVPKYVRIPELRGFIKAKEISEGVIEVTWRQYISPGGLISDFIVLRKLIPGLKTLIKLTAYETFLNLKQIIQNPKYQQAVVSYSWGGDVLGVTMPEN